jgi:hypothetical protein
MSLGDLLQHAASTANGRLKSAGIMRNGGEGVVRRKNRSNNDVDAADDDEELEGGIHISRFKAAMSCRFVWQNVASEQQGSWLGSV